MNCEILPLVLIRVCGLPLSAKQDAFFPIEKYLEAKKSLENEIQNIENQILEFLNQQLALLPESARRTYYYNLRKAFFNQRENQVLKLIAHHATDDLSPFLSAWKAARDKQSAYYQRTEKAYQDQLHREWTALQQFAHSEELRRSLLFSSHELLKALPHFSAKNISDWDKKDRQIAFSLLEYQQRGQYKTSPFSRLTTLHLHPLHKSTTVTEAEEIGFSMPDQKVVITPNAAILPALYEVLFQEPSFYRSLSLRLNPSVQIIDHQYFWLYFDGEQEAVQQTAVSKALQCVHKVFEASALTYPIALAQLSEYIDQREDLLHAFIQELTELGFLAWILPEKGLSSSWSSTLYQYLGFLPPSQIITETAYYLHWLRNAARSLPYQSITDAMRTQRDALELLQQHLEKYKVSFPGLRPEQVFYEDVHTEVQLDIPDQDIESWANQFIKWIENQQFKPSSGMREQIQKAGLAQLKPGECMDFLRFDPTFHSDESTAYKRPVPLPSALGASLSISASGAVVNSLFPGGGKLLSRWLHLFPAYVREELSKWPDEGAIAFPWQGWSNANFQYHISQITLEVPDGKISGGRRNIPLSAVEIYHHPQQGLQLREKNTHHVIRFVDLGLEAPETRPPMMQALWHLGVPDVSWSNILRQIRVWERVDDYCFVAQRIDIPNITLSRKAWVIKIEAIKITLDKKQEPYLHYLTLNEFLQGKGIPNRFFAQFPNEKPQFFDRESTVSMALLSKKILHAAEGLLRLEEMLPLPEDWAIRRDGNRRAAEAVVEWKWTGSQDHVFLP